jgi:hypothetical protein
VAAGVAGAAEVPALLPEDIKTAMHEIAAIARTFFVC